MADDQGPQASLIIKGGQDPLVPQDPNPHKPSNSTSTSGPSCTSSTASTKTACTAYATIKLVTF